jgi:hypothetical protein
LRILVNMSAMGSVMSYSINELPIADCQMPIGNRQ